MTVSLQKNKEQKIFALCHELHEYDTCTIHFLQGVIGSLVNCFCVCQLGQLHYCLLEQLKIHSLNKKRFNWDARIHMNSAVKTDLRWWITSLLNSTAPIQLSNPTKVLNTDSSRYDWSGFMDGIKVQGIFCEREMLLSINSKETLAIWYSIQSFKYLLQNKHFLVLSDNCTIISNVNKFGGM